MMINNGSRPLTPQDVERLRQQSQGLYQQASDTSPVGHWAAALTRGLQGYMSGRDRRAADAGEEAGRAGARDAISSSPVLSALIGGDPSATYGAAMPTMPRVEQAAMPTGGNADYIRQGLISRGLPEHVADGFLMNLQDESGLNSGINEQNPIVAGSRGGFGLAQWTGPRRRELEAFAQSRGVPVSDTDLQLDFLVQELGGSESKAAQSILSAQDSATAADAILRNFLRPAEEHVRSRSARYLGGAAPQYGGQASVISALAAAQADPWVQQEYGSVIDALMGQQMQQQNAAYESQLQQLDPAYQLGLEGDRIANQLAQLELDAAMNPVAAIPEPVFEGGQWWDTSTGQPVALTDARIDPTSAMQNFQALVAQGVPEEQAREMAFGGGGVNVNVNNGGQDAFDDAFGKADAATIAGVSDAGLAAARAAEQINALEGVLAQAPSGAAAMWTAKANELGIDIGGAGPAAAAQAIINAMVPAQRPPGSGPMSDADLELFKQSLPRLVNTPEGNALILQTMRHINAYDQEGARIAQALRNGELTRSQAFEMLQNRANPLAGVSQQVSAFPDAAPSTAAIPVADMSDDDLINMYSGGN